jgi:O-antigen/teichoic acid export membrane protein
MARLLEKSSAAFRRYFPSGTLRARMASATFWTISGTLSLQLSGMLGGIFCARILGKAGFGKLNILRSTILMFGVLAGTGLGIIATKYISEHRINQPADAGRLLGLVLKASLITGFLASSICIALAPLISEKAMMSIDLKNALRLGGIVLLFNAMNGVQVGAICGFESFRLMARLTYLDAGLSLLCIPMGALIAGLMGAVGGIVVATIASFPIKHLAMIRECNRNEVKISYIGAVGDMREIFRTILPIMILGISFYPFEWISKIFLTRMNGGFAQLGLFAASYSFGSIVLFVPNQLIATTQPFLGSMYGRKDRKAFSRLSWFSIVITGGMGTVMAIVISLFSKLLMRAYGASFVEASSVLVVMAFGFVFNALLAPYYRIHIARGKIWAQASFSGLLGMILVASASFLTQRGALGLAYSYLLAWSLTFAVQSVFVWRMIKPDGRRVPLLDELRLE